MSRFHAPRCHNFLLSSAGLALFCSACTAPPTLQGLADPPRRESPVGIVRMASRPAETRLADPTTAPASDSDVLLTAYSPGSTPDCPPESIVSCPPEPRWPVAGPDPWAVGMPVQDVVCQPSPHRYPEEYLCDGGDRADPVHYHSDQRYGLDTEDTVAEYTDHRGTQRVTPANKVCVYAPRFAAVRTVSLQQEEGTYQELARVDHTHRGGEVRSRLSSQGGYRNLALHAMQTRSRVSGLEGDVLHADLEQRQRPQMADKILNTFQNLNFFQTGTLEQGDTARINLGIRAALVWSREQYPVIQGQVHHPVTGLSEIHSTTLTVIDDLPRDQPGQLRVVKVADRQSALPGEIITFTIRYDNLGPREIHHVRIVDNLTPRLQYVEDSATSDRAGQLVVEDNGEGSLVLTWELEEPLEPHTGGVVTFQALVR